MKDDFEIEKILVRQGGSRGAVAGRSPTFDDVTEIDLDGVVESRGRVYVEYIGRARKQPDGTWQCLAIVNREAICLVEAKIAPQVPA